MPYMDCLGKVDSEVVELSHVDLSGVKSCGKVDIQTEQGLSERHVWSVQSRDSQGHEKVAKPVQLFVCRNMI